VTRLAVSVDERAPTVLVKKIRVKAEGNSMEPAGAAGARSLRLSRRECAGRGVHCKGSGSLKIGLGLAEL